MLRVVSPLYPVSPMMRYDRVPRMPYVDHVLACRGVRHGCGTGARPICADADAHCLWLLRASRTAEPIWEAILQYRPRLFLFLGDNVYGDVRDGKPVDTEAEILDSLRLAYLRAAAIPSLTRLRQTVPHLATWDDHDYGRNDGGAEFVHKRASQQLFAEFWQLPAEARAGSATGSITRRCLAPRAAACR